ncbi:tRNA (guanine(10)-N(2))-dimethyltransferase [[Eubacterium] cellulosolvens]
MKLKMTKENSIKVQVPIPATNTEESKKAPVFYNPKMEVERNLSVLAFQCYQMQKGSKLNICDSMSGSGIRGIRYAKEIKGIKKVILNDLNPLASKLVKKNIRFNKIEDKTVVKNLDVNFLLNFHTEPKKRLDIIDIDPFGSPSPYLDTATRALKSGGLIALTATDLAPLCGAKPEACKRKYGGKPLRTEYCHEIGIRLLIGRLTSIAINHGLSVKLLLGHHLMHYIRIIAILNYGIQAANNCLKKMGYIAHCFNCLNRKAIHKLGRIQNDCDICGSKFSIAGPLWLGELYDKEFCRLMLSDLKYRKFEKKIFIENFLRMILIEKQEFHTFYVVDKICSKMKIKTQSLGKILDKLSLRGYEGSPTHLHRSGFRTDANITEIKSVLKEISEF